MAEENAPSPSCPTCRRPMRLFKYKAEQPSCVFCDVPGEPARDVWLDVGLPVANRSGVRIDVIELGGWKYVVQRLDDDTTADQLREAIPLAMQWRDLLLDAQGPSPRAEETMFSYVHLERHYQDFEPRAAAPTGKSPASSTRSSPSCSPATFNSCTTSIRRIGKSRPKQRCTTRRKSCSGFSASVRKQSRKLWTKALRVAEAGRPLVGAGDRYPIDAADVQRALRWWRNSKERAQLSVAQGDRSLTKT